MTHSTLNPYAVDTAVVATSKCFLELSSKGKTSLVQFVGSESGELLSLVFDLLQYAGQIWYIKVYLGRQRRRGVTDRKNDLEALSCSVDSATGVPNIPLV